MTRPSCAPPYVGSCTPGLADDLRRLLDGPPGAVSRLGESTFATMTAWRLDPDRVRVIYAAGSALSPLLGRPVSDDEAAAFVREHLLLTLDPAEALAESPPVTVWVDRQADPMNISLVGNSGSGRATYVGHCFNLKGIGRTVLATSTDPQRSNGALDLVGALWEAVCANVDAANLRTGAPPVLAVVDLNKGVKVPWYDDPIPTGMIVRLDAHGELDRPSHLFHGGEGVHKEAITDIARAFGRQDAEKYVERVIHGGWSAGNISLRGHLIDYDSVFALRGRAPQWSFRPNWLSNFYGLESQGQKILLEAMATHPLNLDGVVATALHAAFDVARREQLERRFLDLVGVAPNDGETVLAAEHATVAALVSRWEFLAGRMYPNFKATAAWDAENATLSVYDLSRFFRLYPLARLRGPVDEQTALGLMRNPLGLMKQSSVTEEGGMPDKVTGPLLANHAVTSDDQLALVDRQALEFVDMYDVFLGRVLRLLGGRTATSSAHASHLALGARAYIVNEERTYMCSRPGHDTLIALLQHFRAGSLDGSGLSRLLTRLVASCDRSSSLLDTGGAFADVQLFLDGYSCLLISIAGEFRPRLTLWRNSRVGIGFADRVPISDGTWTVECDGMRWNCQIDQEAEGVHVVGPIFPIDRLAADRPKWRFYCNGTPVDLRLIRRLDRQTSAEAE